jgi:hypothetical protein
MGKVWPKLLVVEYASIPLVLKKYLEYDSKQSCTLELYRPHSTLTILPNKLKY